MEQFDLVTEPNERIQWRSDNLIDNDNANEKKKNNQQCSPAKCDGIESYNRQKLEKAGILHISKNGNHI